MLDKNKKLYIAGHKGMVGSAIQRKFEAEGFDNFVTRTVDELDLRNQFAVTEFFELEKPDYVIVAAAKVGGILANNTYRAEFIYDNLMIESNLIQAAHQHGVEKLLFLGSSCIYPKLAPQPLKEEYLLTAQLEPTNEPYAIAKIAGIKMCEAYNRQYHTRFLAVMPTNLYGPNDNFSLETSHVLPALIRKFHEARISHAERVVIWGTGSPRREFLHVDDMADACVHVMTLSDSDIETHLTHYPSPCFVNVGTGKDCTIKELALLIKEISGFQGILEFDTTRPDGTQVKRLDVSRLKNLGWQAKISLEDGILETYNWFVKKQAWRMIKDVS